VKRIFIALTAILAVTLGIAAPAQATPFNGAGFYYAGASQTLTGTDSASGLAANFLITQPYVPTVINNGVYDHSLAELAVSATTSGTAGNTVEVGITESKDAYGDFKPRLFACAWTAGATVGCYTGGSTWVDYASNALNIGGDVSADVGTSKTISVTYASTGCGTRPSGWWVAYGGNWIGCYTDQTWSTAFTTAKFYQAFGEYYYNGINNPGTSNDKPCGDMGNGLAPASGGSPGTGMAYIASLSLQNVSMGLVTSFTLFTPTDSAAYNANWTVPGSTTRSFYYGGPGYKFVSGVATTPGNTGSC
jgi:hypothetical protein